MNLILILKPTLTGSSCRADGIKRRDMVRSTAGVLAQDGAGVCSLWISWLQVLGGKGRGHGEKGSRCLLDSWLGRDE